MPAPITHDGLDQLVVDLVRLRQETEAIASMTSSMVETSQDQSLRLLDAVSHALQAATTSLVLVASEMQARTVALAADVARVDQAVRNVDGRVCGIEGL